MQIIFSNAELPYTTRRHDRNLSSESMVQLGQSLFSNPTDPLVYPNPVFNGGVGMRPRSRLHGNPIEGFGVGGIAQAPLAIGIDAHYGAFGDGEDAAIDLKFAVSVGEDVDFFVMAMLVVEGDRDARGQLVYRDFGAGEGEKLF